MKILNALKKHIFYRQHPDTALRYLPMVDILKNKGLENSKIIEIGSGSYGITPYLKREIVGVDISFDEPQHELLKQVKSSGNKLPFKDSEFDVAILSDVLEHVPADKRINILNEAIRVASKNVIIGGPFGKDAFNQDKVLAEESRKGTGSMHKYLKEHLDYGLPEVEDILNIAKQSPKVKSAVKMGEFLNLGVRRILMNFFISKYKIVFFFYLKGLMFLVPILKHCNFKPCYRTLILISLQ